MAGRKQISCVYDGYRRELCPHILGHNKQGREVALTYQFAGQSSSGLPPGGEWRFLQLSKVSNVRLRDGPWHGGDGHTRPHVCVDIVDLDVNPQSLSPGAATLTGRRGLPHLRGRLPPVDLRVWMPERSKPRSTPPGSGATA